MNLWNLERKWTLFVCVWLFATPWTIQSMEFSRPEYQSGYLFPSSGDLPNPGIEPRSPILQVDSLPAESPGKPKNPGVGSLSLTQGIFPTQESNQDLLHCRQILCQLSSPGSPCETLGAPFSNTRKGRDLSLHCLSFSLWPHCVAHGCSGYSSEWTLLFSFLMILCGGVCLVVIMMSGTGPDTTLGKSGGNVCWRLAPACMVQGVPQHFQLIALLSTGRNFPQWLSNKESTCNAEDTGSVPVLGRSPGWGRSNPLQYSCLENLMDRGTWQFMIHGVAKIQTQRKRLSTHNDGK